MTNSKYFACIILLILVLLAVPSCISQTAQHPVADPQLQSPAQQYPDQGTTLSENEKYELAIQELTKAIELDPNNASAYYERSKLYPFLDSWDMAIEDCDKAIQLDPQLNDAHKVRGLAWLHKKEYARAATDLLWVESSFPDDLLNLANLAIKPGEVVLMDLRCASSGGHDCKGSYMPYTSVISTHLFVNPGESGLEINTINIDPPIDGKSQVNSPRKYFRTLGVEYLVVLVSSRNAPGAISSCSVNYRKIGDAYYSKSNETQKIKVSVTESSSTCPLN